ncbi:hypothetical protein PsYK624_084230 [Phanerochaete sordida]|uniref:F-box domain-containing protein n=1 Tax=Phanerochaete sordida TaxID=48140 RepID=A0A9P3GEH8_9APHY|nr:hypothetical protein PsYK624_084230 [Phanerochaete sordida]
MQSRYRNIPLKQWTVKSPGHRAPVFFEMDQRQDLLIVIESFYISGEVLSGLKIDSLSLSTGQRHPAGRQQPIELAFAFPVTFVTDMRLYISDHHIAVILFHLGNPMSHSEIWLWDWKTGELKLNIYGVPKIGRVLASSLVFLDATHILVPLWTPMGPLQDAYIMHLRVFSFEPGDALRRTFEDTEAVAVFMLPELGQRVNVLKLDGGGNPFTQHPPPTDSEAPFEADMCSRIFVLNIVLETSSDRQLYFHLFAPMAVFERSCAVRRLHVVDWDSWADEARLVRKQPRGMVSDGHIFQNRALFPELRDSGGSEETESTDSTRFVIYDFSLPAALRRDAQSQKFRNCEYFLEPTELDNEGNAWGHPITTGQSLPFRKIWTPFRLPMRSGMFSLVEDSVILGENEESSWRIKQF